MEDVHKSNPKCYTNLSFDGGVRNDDGEFLSEKDRREHIILKKKIREVARLKI